MIDDVYKKSVLISDDDPMILKQLAKELKRNFFNVYVAANGKESIEILDKYNVDIALLDYKLPDMSGLDLLDKIQFQQPDCETIIMTGYGNQEVAIQALRKGAIDYLDKPIDEEVLSAALGRALEKLGERKELQYKNTILVLDDEEILVKKMSRFLTREGFDVYGAYNGQDGLEIISNSKIDVLISDIQMEDMDGIEVFKKARKLYQDIEGIIITGQMSSELPIYSLRCGIFDYMTKPIDLDALVFSINKALERLKLNRTRLYRNRELQISSEIISKMNEELERRILERSRELDQVQAQLFQTSKLATLGEMSAGIAHEINQPLGGLVLVAKSLRKMHERKVLTEKEMSQGLDDIDASARRITKIIQHMRTFARQEVMKVVEVDVNKTIRAALSMLKEQLRLHEIKVETNLNSDLPRIVGESNQLEQVWINLISNARDAFDEMDTSMPKYFFISSKVDRLGESMVISFQDNGPGMTPEVKKKALEPFFTTKEVGKGMGLGLSISYGIISNHKGLIFIESNENKGTLISVTLPIGARRE